MSGCVAGAFAALAVLLCFQPAGLAGPRPGLRPILVAVPLVVLLLAGLPARRLVLLLIVLGSLADLARRFRRRRCRAEERHRAELLRATCEAIAADLRAGLPPARALAAAAEEWPEMVPVLRAATWGADVPAALRELAARPGAEQARVLAAAWQVAHRSGAGLASTLGIAARELREDRATAAVVETELATARATATLLALLPAGMLALGSGVGGDPLAFLVDSGAGLACLAVGLLLVHLGLRWIDAIAEGISR